MNHTLLTRTQRTLLRCAIVALIPATFITGVLVSPLVTPLTIPSRAASEPALIDLTGAWTADDGGTYYLRQMGNAIWWIGLDATDGRNFSNVFHGSLEGALITGNWADVPRGAAMSSGTLAIEVVETPRGVKLRKTRETGGFGGSTWSRTSRPPAPNQQPAAQSRRIMLNDGTVEIREPDGTVRQYHPNGSTTITFPDGRRQVQLPHQTQVPTPPLSLLAGSNLKPWLEAHNRGLLSILEGLLTPEEREHSLRALSSAESGKSLYDQIDFRTGAIHRLRR